MDEDSACVCDDSASKIDRSSSCTCDINRTNIDWENARCHTETRESDVIGPPIRSSDAGAADKIVCIEGNPCNCICIEISIECDCPARFSEVDRRRTYLSYCTICAVIDYECSDASCAANS